MLIVLTLGALLTLPVLWAGAADAPDGATTRRAVPPGGLRANRQRPQQRAPRLPRPWSDLTQLTEEQKVKIAEIRREIAVQRQALNQREREQIMAVLTDVQKAELQQIQERQEQERTLRDEARRLERLQQAPEAARPKAAN
jgi:hypothetical protein